jgi:hypothetical protein
MLNPFFLQGSSGEKDLVQDLINEHLKIYGVEIYYLPRQYVTEKTVIKEVIESEFKNAYPLEAYLENYNGYSGQGTILSKFGIQELDEMVLTISRERFETYITPLIKDIPNIKLATRPKEGDLIWFPLGDRIFEIKYVEHEQPFYQLQGNYTYELRCELFRYGDEVIDTGIGNIDDNTSNIGYIQTLKMVGVGSTASAFTNIVNGGVRFVTITNRGSGYKSSPVVAFSSAPFGGITAVGVATMIGGIVDFCEPDSSLLRVQGVELINPGAGYTVAPKISFTGGSGTGAAATCTIADGIVGIITITSGGSGYASNPPITFVGAASSTAIARAIVENGSITQIRIVDTGEGYIGIPTIIIGNPILIGSGKYSYNEILVGSASSVTARVKSWNVVSRTLEISNISGNFILGETLVGQESGAQYVVQRIYTDNVKDSGDMSDDATPTLIENGPDQYAQNRQIQLDANDILDFSDTNPFGTP